jgi:hypothetical protein
MRYVLEAHEPLYLSAHEWREDVVFYSMIDLLVLY